MHGRAGVRVRTRVSVLAHLCPCLPLPTPLLFHFLASRSTSHTKGKKLVRTFSLPGNVRWALAMRPVSIITFNERLPLETTRRTAGETPTQRIQDTCPSPHSTEMLEPIFKLTECLQSGLPPPWCQHCLWSFPSPTCWRPVTPSCAVSLLDLSG